MPKYILLIYMLLIKIFLLLLIFHQGSLKDNNSLGNEGKSKGNTSVALTLNNFINRM